MYIRTGFELVFNLPAPASMLVLLHVHPDRAHDLTAPEQILIQPNVGYQDFIDSFGNRCAKITAPAGELRFFNDVVVADSGLPDELGWGAWQHTVEELPPQVMPFLLSSRYCEVDRLSETAWNLFGHTNLGWPRVQAILDFVHQHIQFGYQFARNTRTAYEAYQERVGVCRDFTHLAVTFLRCMNIPARYATGYLGDIGIPPVPFPMDFSAWLEVYLGNRWYTVDARHNTPRIGRILMARGRDATDCALTTSFGFANLTSFRVWTDEIQG